MEKYERATKRITNIINRAYESSIYDSDSKKSKVVTWFGNQNLSVYTLKNQ